MARDHLAPGGTFVMYNYYQPFLLDRYANALDQVFGSRPCVELGNTLSRPPAGCAHRGSLGDHAPNCSTFWNGHQVAPVSDDRPFPYLPDAIDPQPLPGGDGAHPRWGPSLRSVSPEGR